MGKICGIQIRNYCSLKDVQIGKILGDNSHDELTNMNAFIGENGTGKSSLADVFGFIMDCLNYDVESACDLNNRGGYDRIISQGAKDGIQFQIYYRESSNSQPITYALKINLDSSGRPFVEEERLRQRRSNSRAVGQPLSFLQLANGKGYAFTGPEGGLDDQSTDENGEKVPVELADNRKLGIATLGELSEHPRIIKFKNFLKSWFLCYFSPGAAREITTNGPQQYLDKNGKNLNNVAQFMERDDPKGFRKVLNTIQTKIPGIEEIVPEKMPNGQLVLKFKESGFTDYFYSQKMSDGTLKLLAYYLLLNEKSPRQLVFIEEPENGLYHKYMGELASEMRAAVGEGFKRQLFVTTHSPFFVNALKPEQVWVLRKEKDGFTSIKCAAEFSFVKNLIEEGVPLGDLWYSNYFNEKE